MTLLDNLAKCRKGEPHGQPFPLIHNLTKSLPANMSKSIYRYQFHFGAAVGFLGPVAVGTAFGLRLD